VLFQTLDNKEDCVGIYCNGRIYKENFPEVLSGTWSYAPYLDGYDIKYAGLYCGRISVEAALPEHLEDRWSTISDKLKAFLRSFEQAKVDLNENCFFELVPERFLLEFCDVKNKITKHVFENYEEPKNYDFLVDLSKVLYEIENRKLNIDLSPLDKTIYKFKTRQMRNKILGVEPYIKYDIFGTKTGRLTTKKNSFPILTLAKEYRSVMKPENDRFVEFDFNAAELRTLLALSGKKQPKEDIHEWNVKNVYRGLVSRKEAKQRIFAWLYNPESKDYLSDRVYDRGLVIKKYFDGAQVSTFFNRTIPADGHHALNYIIQSTTSDLFLRRMIEVHNFLRDKKSFISFCLHDSLVVDFAEEEKHLISEIKQIFSETDLGRFVVNISVGKNFGEMKRIKL
tara:strand:- start:943 stop:2130 length:1188 start_codon:yes stop_codon:yes gene_type:complete